MIDLDNPTMPFGKHRGRPLSALSRPYLSFIFALPNIDDDLADAIRSELSRRGLPFGKFKGQPLSEIPDSYLLWLRTITLLPPLDSLDSLVLAELGKRNVTLPPE